MYQDLINKDTKLSVIGLGYVGLPIALEFARHISVVGFDINEERVEMMKNNVDPSQELESSAFEGTDIQFTANPADLKDTTNHFTLHSFTFFFVRIVLEFGRNIATESVRLYIEGCRSPLTYVT